MTARFFNRERDTIGAAALRALQDERLRALVERCYRDIPHYRALFDARGLAPRHIRTTDDLVHLPTLAKADLRALYPFGLLGVDPGRIVRFAASSGTTGVPTVIGFSRHDWEVTLPDVLGRIFTCFGMDERTFLYQSHGYGLFLGGILFERGLETIGATLFPAGPGRTLAAIQWLRDMRHTAISGTPTFIQTLLARAREQGIEPRRDWALRLAACGGEPASPGLRARITAGMPEGFVHHEQYGTSEVGCFCAHSCPVRGTEPEMHVVADHFFVEVLDPATGRRVGPGEEGELVVTTLTREASPMIRWNTRDLVRVAAEPTGCACGRVAHPKISRILGRSDDVLKVRGTLVLPSQVEDALAAVPGTTEGWQIVLPAGEEELGRLRLEAEVTEEVWGDAGQRARLERRLVDEITARCGTSADVALAAPGSLPRYEGKAQRVVRSRAP